MRWRWKPYQNPTHDKTTLAAGLRQPYITTPICTAAGGSHSQQPAAALAALAARAAALGAPAVLGALAPLLALPSPSPSVAADPWAPLGHLTPQAAAAQACWARILTETPAEPHPAADPLKQRPRRRCLAGQNPPQSPGPGEGLRARQPGEGLPARQQALHEQVRQRAPKPRHWPEPGSGRPAAAGPAARPEAAAAEAVARAQPRRTAAGPETAPCQSDGAM